MASPASAHDGLSTSLDEQIADVLAQLYGQWAASPEHMPQPPSFDHLTRRESGVLRRVYSSSDPPEGDALDLAKRIIRRSRIRELVGHELRREPQLRISFSERKRLRVEARDAESRRYPPSNERHDAVTAEPSNDDVGREGQRDSNVISLAERRVLPRACRREPVSSMAWRSEQAIDWHEQW
jgi:hypothetical protein